jgi:hypothetical protein
VGGVGFVAALSYEGFISIGFAAGPLILFLVGRLYTDPNHAGGAAFTYESIAFGAATRLLASSAFNIAGGAATATAMPTVGALLSGATTGAGILVVSTDDQPDIPTSDDFLQQARERIADCEKTNDDDNRCTTHEEYLLTPHAVLAIVKAWEIETYDPPKTDCASWLGKVHDVCEEYAIPVKQRTCCASHRMREDCREAVLAAGCYNMTWDEFAAWIRRYDGISYVLIRLAS